MLNMKPDGKVVSVVDESPVGRLILRASAAGVTAVEFDRGDSQESRAPSCDRAGGGAAHLDAMAAELTHYFAGELREFKTPLDPAGTDFQRRVWDELLKVPFGQTRTYAQIAAAIGRPAAVRAVARANATNPIAIVIPCHRVIGSDGTLTGYGGGLERKAWLLDHERAVAGLALV